MSTKKDLKMLFALSLEDEERLTELAAKLDCSKSYVIRKAIKELHSKLTAPQNRERAVEMKDDFFIERRRAQG